MINWVQVYCANCGCKYGRVPEQSCDFAFWLCDPCYERVGKDFQGAVMPNEIFWHKARMEMLEKHGRILTIEEVMKATETSSPLTTLLREGVKT